MALTFPDLLWAPPAAPHPHSMPHRVTSSMNGWVQPPAPGPSPDHVDSARHTAQIQPFHPFDLNVSILAGQSGGRAFAAKPAVSLGAAHACTPGPTCRGRLPAGQQAACPARSLGGRNAARPVPPPQRSFYPPGGDAAGRVVVMKFYAFFPVGTKSMPSAPSWGCFRPKGASWLANAPGAAEPPGFCSPCASSLRLWFPRVKSKQETIALHPASTRSLVRPAWMDCGPRSARKPAAEKGRGGREPPAPVTGSARDENRPLISCRWGPLTLTGGPGGF